MEASNVAEASEAMGASEGMEASKAMLASLAEESFSNFEPLPPERRKLLSQRSHY